MLPFAELWARDGIPVVFYDQLGCAASTHLPEKAGDESFWNEDLFVLELNTVLDYLKLRSGFHLLGQSWGGRFGAAFASNQPEGLQRLVIAGSVASCDIGTQAFQQLRAELPDNHREAIAESERSGGKAETPEIQEAKNYFIKTYMCRTEPPPPELISTFKYLNEDKTVYEAM